ncbi:circadian clock protein KaiC [Actinopolymorpha sp. B17G11]|uniref:circadian clock protein KaiC n=1 Tax=Actinopolymorpha sp. B17G11 TaxID=3160861 RepID=UPI0032E4B277
MSDGAALDRVPTGISGFDLVALGGLPAGRCTLVSGSTGSGKTLFAIEFLARGVDRFDDPGVYVTFEESPADLRRNAAAMGFPIERWEREGKWIFVDASAEIAGETTTVGVYNFAAITARIDAAVRQIGARRVSLDSVGSIFTRFPDVAMVRYELHRIATAMEGLGVTSVLTAERTVEYDGVSRLGVEEFVLNNVIILRNVLSNERRRRTVEIIKLRGAAHRTGEWLFTIDEREGIVVIPLAFVAPRATASAERVSSGNPGLDTLCGGGFYKDAVVLLTGPTGTGKTLTSLKFAAEAVRSGESCLLYTFDENHDQLARNAAGWGLDLAAMEASGLLHVSADYPEMASLEVHFLNVRRAIEEIRPSRLVIDTLSALERIATSRALLDFVIALGSLLRRHNVTALLTAAPSGYRPTAVSSAIAVELGSLADVTIMLRYVEAEGQIQRAIAVLQTRGSAHDNAIRMVDIDADGMHIGEPLSVVSHVIPGGHYVPPTQQ